MPASFESVRHDRRYKVDASGVTEFGLDHALRQFLPWCSVDRIEFDHDVFRGVVRWSVRAADGSKLSPKLDYATSLECYGATIRTWRSFMPDACRSHFAREYRKWARTLALLHLFWVIPAIYVYTLMGLSYWLSAGFAWEEVGPMSRLAAMNYAGCVALHLFVVKRSPTNFDRWYARLEASFIEPRSPSPVSSSAFLRWLFPSPVASDGEEPITGQERRVYRRWATASVMPILILVPLLGYGWYLALTWSASLFQQEAGDTLFLVKPGAAFWAPIAVVLGIVTLPIPLVVLYRALLRGRYRRFQLCCFERTGFDWSRLYTWLAAIVFIGFVVSALAAVTSFSRFTETGVEIRRPLSLRSRFYEYSRVKAIEHRATFQAPIGNTVKRPHHVIIFDDGTSWTSLDGLRDPVPELDGRIVQLVSQRSQRPVIKQP